MLYNWLYPLHTEFSFLNVFRYQSFRIIYAAVTAFLIAFVLAPAVIRKPQEIKLGQQIRDDGPKRHLAKSGAPTMGRILIIFAVTLSTLLWADISRSIIWLVLGATLGFFAIGFADDYLKFVKAQSKGLTPRQKFTAQVSVALAVALVLYFLPGYSTKLSVPFFKSFTPDLAPNCRFQDCIFRDWGTWHLEPRTIQSCNMNSCNPAMPTSSRPHIGTALAVQFGAVPETA